MASLEEKLTPAQLSRFQEVAQSGVSSREVVRTLAAEGIVVGVSSVLRYRRANPVPAVAVAPRGNAILMRENARLKRQLQEQESGWGIIREVLNEVYAEPWEIEVQTPKASELPGSPEVAVLHFTDTHWGKLTPTYDIATCEARMQQAVSAVSEITALRREVAPIDECVVLLGGDFIEGQGIFPGQAFETSGDLIEQMVKGGPTYVVNALLSLLQIFPRLRVHAVPGNHGRLSKFFSHRDNADSVFYEIVRKIVQVASPEAEARIVWDLPLDRERGRQWYSRFNITGPWEGLLVHGDQVKSTLGYSAYGWGKKIGGWSMAADTRGFTHCFGGHWHTHMTMDFNGVTLFSTGSMESSNAYALETMAAGGRPLQRLVFMNERYGTLADYPLILN